MAMKIFFDMEFTGLHQKTTPISIGMVSESGLEFYAEFTDYDDSQVDEWIHENVIGNLVMSDYEDGLFPPVTTAVLGTKNEVAVELRRWLRQFDFVEMYSDCLAYDWVLFCDIFGHAFFIPENVSRAPHDINQDIAYYLGISENEAFDISREDLAGFSHHNKHNALWDARIIQTCYSRTQTIHKPRPSIAKENGELWLALSSLYRSCVTALEQLDSRSSEFDAVANALDLDMTKVQFMLFGGDNNSPTPQGNE